MDSKLLGGEIYADNDNNNIYRFDAGCDYNKDTSWWEISRIDNYSKEDYPYKLKRFTDNPLLVLEYEKNVEDKMLSLKYEDFELHIFSEIGEYTLLSLQEPLEAGKGFKSSYLNYTDEYSCVEEPEIEFEKEV